MANEKLVNKTNLKAFRQTFQQKIENGDIVAGKALLAEQLEVISPESGSYQEKPFIFQATGTDSNTTETPTAPVAKHLELRGNTIIWNQLVDIDTTSITPVSGHKYLTMIDGVKSIITSTNTPITVTGGVDNVFDLTQIFGAGKEPTTVEQFNRLFPLPYYAYNPGQFISCKSSKLITVGYNQFENLDTFIRVIAGQTYRLMYWNGTALANLTSGSIEEYDSSKTLIQTTTYSNLSNLHTLDNSYPDNSDKGIKLTNNTQWVKIVNSSNSNILFNLAWDGSRSDYEGYEKHEYTLPNWLGNSARNTYDSYYPEGIEIKRIGKVNLWEVSGWRIDGVRRIQQDAHGCVPIGAKGALNVDSIANIYCNTYDATSYQSVTNANANKKIALNTGGFLGFMDSSFTGTVDQLPAYLQSINAVLYFELATPIVTSGLQTFTENVAVDDFGTMEFIGSETESASNPIVPQGNRFFYPADYALLIDDLNNYTNGDITALALKSDLEDKVDKTTTIAGNTLSSDISANTLLSSLFDITEVSV